MRGYSQKGKLFTELVLEIFRINGRLLVAGDKLVAPFRQTSSRWQVLGALADGPLTVPTIARESGISRQSVQRTADILVTSGLCAFAANPQHQRSQLLVLTRKGKLLLEKIAPVQIAWANRLSGALDESHLKLAVSALRRLARELA